MIATPQIDISSAASFTGTTATTVTTTLITAGTNLNGVVMHYAASMLNSTVTTACETRILAGAVVLCGSRIEAGAILTKDAVMPAPVFIPAGIAVTHQNVVSPAAVQFSISYTIL